MAPTAQRRHNCPSCNATFTRLSNRNRHFATVHGATQRAYDCVICGQVFLDVHLLHLHILQHEPETEYEVTRDLFEGSCTTYRKNYLPPTPSLELTFGKDIDNLTQIITNEAARKKYAKCSIIITVEFIQLEGDEIINSVTIHMRCPSFTITPYQDHSIFVISAQAHFQLNIEEFQLNGSNYILNAVYRTEIDFARCKPLSGSCGLLSVRTCKDLRTLPKSINADNNCFFYAVAAHFTKSDNITDAIHFMYAQIVFEPILTPVKLSSITRFEELNSHLNIRINVLYEEDGNIYPIFVSKRAVGQEVINILLYKTFVGNVAVNHYSYLHDLNKFLRKVYRGKSGNITYQHTYVCHNCLCKFSNQAVLEKHFELCRNNKPQKIELPKEGTTISFESYVKRFKIPIVGFFDFESCMTPPSSSCISCINEELCPHKTKVEAVQNAITYSLVLVNHENRIIHQNTYTGEDCAEQFINHLLDIEPVLQEMLSDIVPMCLTESEERTFRSSIMCHICEKPLTDTRPGKLPELKVRDHDHLTGKSYVNYFYFL